jgi:hypothetical protein
MAVTATTRAMLLPHRNRAQASAAGRLAVLFALLCAAGYPPPTLAQLYRYVDEDGVTVYSQVPPPTGEATTITPDPGPGDAEREAAIERLRGQLESDFDRRTEAERRTGEEATEAADAERRAKNCSAARTNLERLTNLGGRYLTLPDGRMVKPDAEQQQRLIEQARGQIQDNCD